jgi:plasmid stabilization system protein ParE
MPRGDKSAYTDKQERKADHIADSYKEKGLSAKEAERRAWATVNKDDGGGKKSGSGRAPDKRTAAQRSASAKKAAATRKRNAEHHASP